MHLLFAHRFVIPLIEVVLPFQSTNLRKRVKPKLWLAKQRASPATPLLLGFVFMFSVNLVRTTPTGKENVENIAFNNKEKTGTLT